MSFAKSLSIKDDMQKEVNKEARVVSIHILNGLTILTPVDTGRARGNWFLDINRSNRTIDGERRSTQAVAEGVSKIQSAVTFSYPEIVLSNNLPYIERLNDGWSEQTPKKFVETEIDRVVNARGLNG